MERPIVNVRWALEDLKERFEAIPLTQRNPIQALSKIGGLTSIVQADTNSTTLEQELHRICTEAVTLIDRWTNPRHYREATETLEQFERFWRDLNLMIEEGIRFRPVEYQIVMNLIRSTSTLLQAEQMGAEVLIAQEAALAILDRASATPTPA